MYSYEDKMRAVALYIQLGSLFEHPERAHRYVIALESFDERLGQAIGLRVTNGC